MNYPFKCEECGSEFIRTCSLAAYENEEFEKWCPSCRSEKIRRMYNALPLVGEKVKGTSGDGSKGLKGHG